MTYFANVLYYPLVPKKSSFKYMLVFTLLWKVNKEMLLLELDIPNCSKWLLCVFFYFSFCCHERGYLSPEYASFGHISTAVDVYSFGIMILEIISGRKNLDFEKPPEQQILLQWVWINYLVYYNMVYRQILYVTHVCVCVCAIMRTVLQTTLV